MELPFKGMMSFWSAICKKGRNTYLMTTSHTDTKCKIHHLVTVSGYHDASVCFCSVTSTVQGGEGHTHAGEVHTGDGRRCQRTRNLVDDDLQNLHNTQTRCKDGGITAHEGRQRKKKTSPLQLENFEAKVCRF